MMMRFRQLLARKEGSNDHHHSRQREDHGPSGAIGCGSGQPALVHVVAGRLVRHQVEELGLDELAVKVSDGIFEGVLVALPALALVAPSVETTAKDRDALC